MSVGPLRPAVGRGPRGLVTLLYVVWKRRPIRFPSSHERQLMRVRKFGTLLVTSVAAALVTLTFSTAPLAAQEAVIKGKITSESGEPLGGANIVVASTNLGAVTAANGTYRLTIGATAVHGQAV